jgi:ribonuclease P protein component
MRHGQDFAQAVRRGRRAGRPLVAVHLLTPPTGPADPCVTPSLVGLVVSRAVGPAVTRTRVKRRLRHLAAQRLDRLAPGALLVVRANPPAATATSAELGADLDRALERVLDRTRDGAPGAPGHAGHAGRARPAGPVGTP